MSKIELKIYICVDHAETNLAHIEFLKKDLKDVKYKFKYDKDAYFIATLKNDNKMYFIDLSVEVQDVLDIDNNRFGKFLPIQVFIQEWLEPEIGFFCSALAISYPKFTFEEVRSSILIDGYEVKFDYNSYGLIDYSTYERSKSYLNEFCDFIPIQKTITWLLTLCSDNTDQYKNMRIFYNSFTNVINYNYTNSLLYAILGMEALFADKNKRDKKQQLIDNITVLFNKVNSKDISELYKYRSKFVHGEMELRDFFSNDWNIDMGLDYEDIVKELFIIARDLYCNIFQLFITKNKYCIKFEKNTTYTIH